MRSAVTITAMFWRAPLRALGLFAPVLAGAMLLTVFAYVWHRWLRRRPWPQRWL